MDVFLILFKFKNSLATVAVCSDLDLACAYASLLKAVHADIKIKTNEKEKHMAKPRHV